MSQRRVAMLVLNALILQVNGPCAQAFSGLSLTFFATGMLWFSSQPSDSFKKSNNVNRPCCEFGDCENIIVWSIVNARFYFFSKFQDIERDLKQIKPQNIKGGKSSEQKHKAQVINILSFSY